MVISEIYGRHAAKGLKIRSAGRVPASSVDRVAVLPAEDYLSDRDICNNDGNSEGFRCWNTDMDVVNQYETFNRLLVYNGGDMYDSEDSDEDDPLALARAVYVEDYNLDIPEGMDLMVHHRSRSSDDCETRRDSTVDMVLVCQTVSCVTRIGPDEFSDTSGTETAVVNGPDMGDFCQWTSSDEEDCFVSEDLIHTDVESVVDFDSDDSVMDFCIDSNEGSVAELEWNTWDEGCALDFQNASGAFPPDPAVVHPAVEFRDNFTSKEDGEKAVKDLCMTGLSLSAHRHFGQMGNEYVDGDMYSAQLCLLELSVVEDIME